MSRDEDAPGKKWKGLWKMRCLDWESFQGHHLGLQSLLVKADFILLKVMQLLLETAQYLCNCDGLLIFTVHCTSATVVDFSSLQSIVVIVAEELDSASKDKSRLHWYFYMEQMFLFHCLLDLTNHSVILCSLCSSHCALVLYPFMYSILNMYLYQT